MATQIMKAVRQPQYGGVEVLAYEDAPRPEPSEGQVLVQNYATSVNPVDWQTREGYLKDLYNFSMPLILGWDVAGKVAAVGAGVTGFEVGEPVYGMVQMRGGTYAEYVLVAPKELTRKPDALGWNEAGATPLSALTAWQALFDFANLERGQRILIQGAAGGVGSFAVQFAHNAGAYVIGTASAQHKNALTDLGAHEVLDYTATPFEQVVSNVDVVIDTIGGDVQERSWSVLKPGGTLVSTVSSPSPEKAAAHQVTGKQIFVAPNATQLDLIAAQIIKGQVKPIIRQVLPLSEAREGLNLNQKGHGLGKIVLQIAQY